MKIERTVQTAASEDEARDLITSFFEQTGYRQVGSPLSMVYERGSLFGSLTSFSPRGWKVRATVQVQPDARGEAEVQVKQEVNTIGQIVTAKERSFWDDEIADLAATLGANKVSVATSSEAASSSLRQNLVALLAIVIIAATTTTVGRLLWGHPIGTWVGVAVGLTAGFVIIRRM